MRRQQNSRKFIRLHCRELFWCRLHFSLNFCIFEPIRFSQSRALLVVPQTGFCYRQRHKNSTRLAAHPEVARLISVAPRASGANCAPSGLFSDRKLTIIRFAPPCKIMLTQAPAWQPRRNVVSAICPAWSRSIQGKVYATCSCKYS
jgi:hypothetical protein